MRKIVLLAGFLGLATWASAQSNYLSYDQLKNRLTKLSTDHAARLSVSSIGKSAGGKDIWAVTLGEKGSTKPALLILAGVNGEHLAGTELAVQVTEKLLTHASADVKALLASKTVYIIPVGSPDALDAITAKVKMTKSTNATPFDGDRDGRVDEDGPEDLNGDGKITFMRILDPTGTFITHPDNPAVMIPADPSKKQVGTHIVLTEGIDNDRDGQWNEDGPGGVNIDKNFTFDYPIFEDGAGTYTASEKETQAILEFLYEHPNIFATLTFGPANNLTVAPKFDRTKAGRRIPIGWLEPDAEVNGQVSKWYNQQVSEKNAPELPMTKGNFAQTAYYHAGRFSFSTPGWWVPADTAKKAAPSKEKVDPMVDFLRWAKAEKLSDVMVEWKSISHPDFPGKTVEVGGIAPYALLNPPVEYLKPVADKHTAFVVDVLQAMPKIQVVNQKIETLSPGLNRVTVEVVNKGLLPTYAAIGDRVRFVKKMKTTLDLGTGQTLISGKKMDLSKSLKADEKLTYTWLVQGAGKVKITAGCDTAGESSIEITLK
ncbi:MAG: M14 family metallopeptidase [Spirosomataceae bacterium]